MAVTLRDGWARPPLFVFPGAGGAAQELAALAAALPLARTVVALVPAAADAAEPAAVEAMAARAVEAIRTRQPSGPYHLLGYSFGGLVALEAARRLQAVGEAVAFVGLVDTIFDRRWWPLPRFLGAQVRRAAGHLVRLSRRPWREAAPELAGRARALVRRLAQRAAPAAPPARPADSASMLDLCLAAAARHPPRPYTGPVVFFAARQDHDFGLDPAGLWAPWLADLEIQRIDAAHLDLVRAPAGVAALAGAVDAALARAAAPRPTRVLVAASFTWISAARLALALSEAGFAVQAVCPRRHSLWRLGFVERAHPLRAFHPEASLARAVVAARPDLILACDDPAAQALHALQVAADPRDGRGAWLRARLASAFGPPQTRALVYSRAAIMTTAGEEGVRHPPTARVHDRAGLIAWRAAHPGPAMLKTDGSWGGREVALVDSAASAAKACRRLDRPPGLLRALKRLLVDGDVLSLRAWLARRRPALSIQAFVPGAPANAAVACLDGQVLAAVYAEVLRSDGRTGPATVVRLIDHPEVEAAVRAMVRRLGLSGLCGFDFILDPETGAAHLIELNPRATPTAHLVSARGQDLMATLHAAVRRTPPPPRKPAYAGGLVALFPQEMRRDPVSEFLRSAHHDVPWHAPDLVEAALVQAQASRAALDRLAHRRQSDA